MSRMVFYDSEGNEMLDSELFDSAKEPDMVNQPPHYTQGGIECIDAIRASMSSESFQGFCKGNVIKYLWRSAYKNGLEDLQKAEVYLRWMIDSMENEKMTT